MNIIKNIVLAFLEILLYFCISMLGGFFISVSVAITFTAETLDRRHLFLNKSKVTNVNQTKS